MTVAAKDTEEAKRPRTVDLEIKDAHLIFDSVWDELRGEFGEEELTFPKELFWLNGAPGAGKGTQTRFIQEFRDITEEPVVVSSLLESEEARRLKDAGMMVGDREVTRLVFHKILEPEYANGAVVDGYPRTKVQVECLKLLYLRLMEMRKRHRNTLLAQRFPKPVFHIIVLFVDEAESVRRQLIRGRQNLEHNKEVEASGMGEMIDVRPTDLSDEAARNRYRTFKEVTYESLKSLREVFHYHYINAHGTVAEVQRRIVDELRYQSSLELDESTYDTISAVPIATNLSRHARQELVNRLDSYERDNPELFHRVVSIITEKYLEIIRRHAISGLAFINSEDELWTDPAALAMLIDVFSERGYHLVVDIRKEEIPMSIDPKTFRIKTRIKRVYRFRVMFERCEIRRG